MREAVSLAYGEARDKLPFTRVLPIVSGPDREDEADGNVASHQAFHMRKEYAINSYYSFILSEYRFQT